MSSQPCTFANDVVEVGTDSGALVVDAPFDSEHTMPADARAHTSAMPSPSMYVVPGASNCAAPKIASSSSGVGPVGGGGPDCAPTVSASRSASVPLKWSSSTLPAMPDTWPDDVYCQNVQCDQCDDTVDGHDPP